jgi:methylase of polypeptide subunit release factors
MSIAVHELSLDHLGLKLCIPPTVDAPRAELAKALTFELPVARGKRVLDLGCGAGLYTALAVKAGCSVLATDVDAHALTVTHENLLRNGLAVEHVRFGLGDLFEATPPDFKCDLIIANLPQTPCADDLPMHANFRAAKWAGIDGLRYVRRLFESFASHLYEGGGLMMLQIGWLDWHHIDAILSQQGYTGTVLGTAERHFAWDEYESYAPGLADFMKDRVAKGIAQPIVTSLSPEGLEELAFPVRWIVYRR